MTERIVDNHPDNLDRFDRFAQLSGLEIEDPQARINKLKSLTSEQFLNLLSVANGLLTDKSEFSRWTGKAVLSQVGMNGIIDVHPPDNAHEDFSAFFDELKESISNEDDIDRAAVETYFAIIGSHMFKDGNGRTARSIYELIRNGKLPDNHDVIIDRQKNSVFAASRLNASTIHTMFVKEGYIYGEEFNQVTDLAADDEVAQEDFFMLPGLDSQLKYISARRVMERAGVWEKKGANKMGLKDWPKNRFDEFSEEFAHVRSEWFSQFTKLSGEYTEFFIDKLEEGVNRSVSVDEMNQLEDA